MEFESRNTTIAARNNQIREQGLDQTLAETFPCSDPLSSIPNPRELSEANTI